MEKQHITLEEVKTASRLAYDENRLAAQNTDSAEDTEDYFYRRGDVGCAIGVALTPETAKQVDPDHSCKTLMSDATILREIFTWSESEHDALGAIQLAHDNWRNAAVGVSLWSETDAENNFRHLIDYEE